MKWAGQAHIGAGWAAFVGRAGDNRPHAHHALQVVVSFDAPVSLWTASGGVQSVQAAVLDRDVRHALHPSDAEVGLLYLEAESAPARAMRGHVGLRERLADTTSLRSHFEAAAWGSSHAVTHLLSTFDAVSSSAPADDLIQDVLRRLSLEADLPSSLSALAAWAGLSGSRFAHRFRLHTGMPVRPYLRWLRLQRAARAITGRASITQAAHEAGFADAAHLTRTFQRHFGITPSVLATLSAPRDA